MVGRDEPAHRDAAETRVVPAVAEDGEGKEFIGPFDASLATPGWAGLAVEHRVPDGYDITARLAIDCPTPASAEFHRVGLLARRRVYAKDVLRPPGLGGVDCGGVLGIGGLERGFGDGLLHVQVDRIRAFAAMPEDGILGLGDAV